MIVILSISISALDPLKIDIFFIIRYRIPFMKKALSQLFLD